MKLWNVTSVKFGVVSAEIVRAENKDVVLAFAKMDGIEALAIKQFPYGIKIVGGTLVAGTKTYINLEGLSCDELFQITYEEPELC